MRLDIITFNKVKVRNGIIFSYIGLFILFLNIIPGISELIHFLITTAAILILSIGFVIVNKYEDKIKVIGFIEINNYVTLLYINKLVKEIDNSKFNIKFSNSGYKGMSNYSPPITLGAYTSHNGINNIRFYNAKEDYKFEIQITSQRQYIAFKQILANQYAEI